MTAQELLSYAVRCGLSAADLNRFSIGFLIDYIETYFALKNNKNIHADEEKYQKLKSVLPFVEEKYRNGDISQRQYDEFITNYSELEARYGE